MAAGSQGSNLKVYSIAVVANNKPLDTNDIVATPIEKLTMLDGEIVSMPYDQEAAGNSVDGSAYQTKVTVDSAVRAKWLPWGGSNRRTAPDVRRGERVLLLQFADNNDFYWTSMGLDDHLRKLETVIFSISATQDEAADSLAPENSYTLEMSSHTQTITLKTSKANGEYCVYALQLNLKEGRVVLTDDMDNEIEFNTAETLISMINADGTKWQLDKKIIYGYAPDMIHMVAENKIHMETNEFVLDCQTGQVNASTSFTFDTPQFRVNSEQNTFNTPNTTFMGNVGIQGNLNTSTGGGTAVFNGPVQFLQHVQAAGITSTLPIQGPSDTI